MEQSMDGVTGIISSIACLVGGLAVLLNFGRVVAWVNKIEAPISNSRFGRFIPAATRFRVGFFGGLLTLGGAVGLWDFVVRHFANR